MIDRDGTYFNILDRLLNENREAVALIACNDSRIKRHLKSMEHSDKVYIQPFRQDIHTLFEHIDIYYATYPVSGSLMMLYASISGKPMVSYQREPTPLIGSDMFSSQRITNGMFFDDVDKLSDYTHALCQDSSFREEEGRALQTDLQTEEQFSRQFLEMLNGGCLPPAYSLSFDYEKIFEQYLSNHNIDKSFSRRLLLSTLKYHFNIRYLKYAIDLLSIELRNLSTRKNVA